MSDQSFSEQGLQQMKCLILLFLDILNYCLDLIFTTRTSVSWILNLCWVINQIIQSRRHPFALLILIMISFYTQSIYSCREILIQYQITDAV